MAVRSIQFNPDGDVELDEKLIKIVSGQFDVGLLESLNLSNIGIRVLGLNLSLCVSLTDFDISHNRLESLSGIEGAVNLERLNATHNMISDVTPLRFLLKLQVLKLEGNRIASLDSVAQLTQLPALRSISLRGRDEQDPNPVCVSNEEYLADINRLFPRARCLDGRYFCKDEMNPKFVDAGKENEFELPPSKPWVTDADFNGIIWDPAKASLLSERNVRAQTAECLKAAAAATK